MECRTLEDRILECALLSHSKDSSPTYILVDDGHQPIMFLVHGCFEYANSPMHVDGFPDFGFERTETQTGTNLTIQHTVHILKKQWRCKCFDIKKELNANFRLLDICDISMENKTGMYLFFSYLQKADYVYLVVNESLEPFWKEKFYIQFDLGAAVDVE